MLNPSPVRCHISERQRNEILSLIRREADDCHESGSPTKTVAWEELAALLDYALPRRGSFYITPFEAEPITLTERTKRFYRALAARLRRPFDEQIQRACNDYVTGELKEHFPWLGSNDGDVSGADTIQELELWYQEVNNA